MRILLIIITLYLISCTPIFINEPKLTNIWIGRHHSELIEQLGPYNKSVDTLTDDNGHILIWEASKESIFIPIENIGAKVDKKGTSVSSIHVYVDINGNVTNIKKSIY